MCLFVYTLWEWSHDSLCIGVCERVSKREMLLALLIIRRWVFTIGKGELERKWWTPCVVGERPPEVTLFADVPYLRLYSRRKYMKAESSPFPCHLHVCLMILLHQIVSSPAECVYQWVSLSVCLCQADRIWWSAVCQPPDRGQTLPGSIRAASAVLRLIAFSYDPCTQACGPVHYSAWTASRRFTHSLAWSGVIDCRLSVKHTQQ